MDEIDFASAMYITARLDFKAAKVLYRNDCYPQAIFFLQQAFEKANKSIKIHIDVDLLHKDQNALEKELMQKPYSHNNRQPTYDVWKYLLDEDKERLQRTGDPRTTATHIEKSYGFIKEDKEFKQEYEILHYRDMIKHYHTYYLGVKKHPELQDAASQAHALQWYLSKCFEGIEGLSRYPASRFHFLNVKVLNDRPAKAACQWLIEMVGDFLDHILGLVKLVDLKLPPYFARAGLVKQTDNNH